jgi:hypothetical protein
MIDGTEALPYKSVGMALEVIPRNAVAPQHAVVRALVT